MDVAAQHAVEQQVRADLARIFICRDDRGLKTVFRCDSGCKPAVVRLGASLGDEHGSSLIEGVLQKVLQFSELVASRGKVGQIVPFAPYINAEILRYISEVLKRRRKVQYLYLFVSKQHRSSSMKQWFMHYGSAASIISKHYIKDGTQSDTYCKENCFSRGCTEKCFSRGQVSPNG